MSPNRRESLITRDVACYINRLQDPASFYGSFLHYIRWRSESVWRIDSRCLRTAFQWVFNSNGPHDVPLTIVALIASRWRMQLWE